MNISPDFLQYVVYPLFIGGHAVIGYSIYEYFADVMPPGSPITSLNSKISDDLDVAYVKNYGGKYLVDSLKNEAGGRGSLVENPTNLARTDDFKNVIDAYKGDPSVPSHGGTGENYLNEACHKLYTKGTFELTDGEKSDLGTFCSIGGIKLMDLSNDAYITTGELNHKLKRGEELRKQLINTRYVGNIGFGGLKQRELEEGGLDEGEPYFKKGEIVRKQCDSIYIGTNEFKGHNRYETKKLTKYCGLQGLDELNKAARTSTIQNAINAVSVQVLGK